MFLREKPGFAIKHMFNIQSSAWNILVGHQEIPNRRLKDLIKPLVVKQLSWEGSK